MNLYENLIIIFVSLSHNLPLALLDALAVVAMPPRSCGREVVLLVEYLEEALRCRCMSASTISGIADCGLLVGLD